jgi:hypothetical protein
VHVLFLQLLTRPAPPAPAGLWVACPSTLDVNNSYKCATICCAVLLLFPGDQKLDTVAFSHFLPHQRLLPEKRTLCVTLQNVLYCCWWPQLVSCNLASLPATPAPAGVLVVCLCNQKRAASLTAAFVLCCCCSKCPKAGHGQLLTFPATPAAAG